MSLGGGEFRGKPPTYDTLAISTPHNYFILMRFRAAALLAALALVSACDGCIRPPQPTVMPGVGLWQRERHHCLKVNALREIVQGAAFV